jgi:hypothetical protein
MPHGKAEPAPGAPPQSTFAKIAKKIWWLHSGFALVFGVGVMLFARHGLAYADKLLIVLLLSWLLMFIALRFIVGPANRSEGEGIGRKGVRLATNYVIKQLYQQMFFFLVPIYASSATWSLSSFNWWLAPVLLVCAVVSTMDLVFDNFIMERRVLASLMYGLAMFGLLNVILPLVFKVTHYQGLMVAAAATPGAVALLSFSAKSVLSPQGVLLTILATGGLIAAVWFGRVAVPPAPLAMPEAAVGHGTPGSYECLPGSKHQIRSDQLDGLRCGSWLVEPGGVKEDVVHVWTHRGKTVLRVVPEKLSCEADGVVYRSALPVESLPADPLGGWTCTIETVGGQLVGVRRFEVVAPKVAETEAGTVDGGGIGDGGGVRDGGGDGDGTRSGTGTGTATATGM